MKYWIRAAVVGVLTVLAGAWLIQFVTFQLFNRPFLAQLVETSEVIPTDRGEVEYASVGSGPPVFFLHGTPGGYDQSLVFADPFVEAGFRFIAVSRPGYLRTPLSVGETPADQADALAALADALGIGAVSVIGGSGGAPSAVELARRHPARVHALVTFVGLLEPKDRSIPPLSTRERLLSRIFGGDYPNWKLLRDMERSPLEEALAFMNEGSRSRLLADSAKVTQLMEMIWTRFPRDRREAGWANDREQFKALDFGDVEEITVPTLVIHGTADVNAPFEGAAAFASRVPNAQLVRVAEGDHYIMVARGDELWDTVIQFLDVATDRRGDER